MDNDIARQWRDVKGEELAYVNERQARPTSNEENLIGLAISGGGIRSATFGLGVLEALKRKGLLRSIDFLSTVSGGGYIGAWLSANCARNAKWLDPASDWLPSIAHLRRYSNYLSPQVGFFSADTWTMVTIWLRNTLLIQTTVLLAIACALLLPRPLFELFNYWPEVGLWRWTSIFLFIVGIVGVAGNQMRLTSAQPVFLLRGSSWPIGLGGGLGILLVAWLYAGVRNFDPFSGGEISYSAALPVAALLVLAGFFMLSVGVRLAAFLPNKGGRPEQINYTQNWVQTMVVVPLMSAALLVAAILWAAARGAAVLPGPGLHDFETYGTLIADAWRFWPFPLSVVAVSIWLLAFCSIHSRRSVKGILTAAWAPAVAALTFHALLCAIMLVLRAWAADPGAGAWKAFVWGPPLVATAFVLTIIVLIGLMGRESTDEVREWWSRLGAWLGIYSSAWMVLAVAAVYGPFLVDWATTQHSWMSMSAGGGWLGTVVAGLFAGNSESTDGSSKKSWSAKAKELLAAVAPFVFIGGVLVGLSYGLDSIVRSNDGGSWLNVDGWEALGEWRGNQQHWRFLIVSSALFGACAAMLLLLAARVDINHFSLNAFYRNRLVRCYLGASRVGAGQQRNPQNFTGFDNEDDLLLTELVPATPPLGGPLHIVNCALNLGGSSDLDVHTRQSAIFSLSPLYCGTPYPALAQRAKDEESLAGDASTQRAALGFVPTATYGGKRGAPTLGQAISVSGAAASPNMGYHTSASTAFLLTLFNVRLGWWFPNPAQGAAAAPSPGFSLRYLISELFGGANESKRYVMISDGGHFENLAAYELVRRRCRVVIVSDGECDPALTFSGLGTLIRMCDIDFGYKISIDVDRLRLPAGGGTWSSARHAIGTIDYGKAAPPGVLIYLKASMTGREGTATLQYKSSHPAFPHESTGDQFYSEDQFESYRALGADVAHEALAPVTSLADLLALANRATT